MNLQAFRGRPISLAVLEEDIHNHVTEIYS